MITDPTGRPASRCASDSATTWFSPAVISNLAGKGLAAFLVVVGSFALPATAHPADGALQADGAHPADRALTAAEAVRMGIEASPAIRAAARALDAARARELQAAALPNPNLTFAGEELPLGNLPAGNYSVGVSQPLLLGGIRAARIQVAESDRIGAELDLAEQKREVAFSVRTALATVHFEAEGHVLAVNQHAGAVAVLAAARKRFKAGDVAALDIILAETEIGRAEAAVALAQDKRTGALARFNALLGRISDTPCALAPSGSDLMTTLPPPRDLVARGQRARLDLRRLEAAIRRDDAQRRLAEAGVWTGSQVSVSGGVAAGSPAVSLSLTLPIPFYRQQGEILEAEAQKLRTEANRDVASREVAGQIEQAHREVLQARRQIELLRDSVVPMARRQADNALRRFEAGEGTGSEVQESGRSYREAEFELRKARLDHQRAFAALERAVGEELKP